MKTLLVGIVLLLAVCTVAATEHYEIGYANNDGYVWKGDGYWYHYDLPYTRKQEAYSYQQYGYGPYYQAYRWRYYRYYPPVAQTPKVPYPADPEWKAKLLDVTATLAKIDGDKQRAALDNQAYLDALDKLGLRGNYAFSGSVGYPQPAYGSYSNVQLGSYGASGSTIYGYSFQTIQDLFGDTSLLNQQYAQATQASQRYAAQAVDGLGSLADKQGVHAARVADTLARGEAARAALQGAQGNSSHIEQRTTVVGATPTPQVIPQAQAAGLQVNSVLQARCASCHSGAEPKGALRLTSWDVLSEEQKQEVFERITTRDATKRMPPAPAPKLSRSEISLFAD